MLLALVDGLICARASLGRTASWSFPIDDAYIYSNYVRAAEAGQPFAYNAPGAPDERSGGVTSAGWMMLLWTVHPLTGLLSEAPAGLAPAAVRVADPALARDAGRFYLAAYLLGGLLLAAAAWACGRLAWECYQALEVPLAGVFAAAAGAILLADTLAIWGSFSGLEVPLSLCLIALAPATLLGALRQAGAGAPRLGASLLAAALLPWARPELAIVGAAGAAWLGLLAIGRPALRRAAVAYAGAVAGGLAALGALFAAFTGRPLPSSFYAKVGAFQPGRATAAVEEWLRAGNWTELAILGLALLGGLALVLVGRGRRGGAPGPGAAPALVLAAGAAYFAAMLLAVRWFGQEDRYILPIHALALPLMIGLPAAVATRPRPAALLARLLAPGRAAGGLALALGLGLIVYAGPLRVWAATDYALFVQNIEDAHVVPALWLAGQAPPGAVLAAEPIGAIRLFGGHPTVDIVGLTTPAQLGHFGDWPATAALLRARQAAYLLYYPHLWPGGQAPAWARLAQTFPVPDNRIAGDDPIAVYRLVWP